MNTRLRSLWEHLRTSFWFVPTLMLIGAALLAFGTLALDQTPRFNIAQELGWVYTGGPEGARSLLSMVAGSVMTVAGTTFSITIAALTLASSQFGPRLLRNFVADCGNQLVLGTFIATFLYCLLVLRTVRGTDANTFVPHLSVTVAIVLAVASLGVLIYFIHHIATAIQADTIITAVTHELDAAIDRLYPEQLGEPHKRLNAPPLDLAERFAQPSAQVAVATSNYVQTIDGDALLQLATEHNLLIRLHFSPGQFVIAGETLAQVWPQEHATAAVSAQVRAAYLLGAQRTETQDASFVVNQLVEIAARALSPGINDPFTAVACVDRLGAALCSLYRRELPAMHRTDAAGTVRIVTTPLDYSALTNIAFDQIRLYGCSSTAVLVRLLETLARLAENTRDRAVLATLLQQAHAAQQSGDDALVSHRDREQVKQQAQTTVQTIEHRQEHL